MNLVKYNDFLFLYVERFQYVLALEIQENFGANLHFFDNYHRVCVANFVLIGICRMLFDILEEIVPIGFSLTFIWTVSSITILFC